MPTRPGKVALDGGSTLAAVHDIGTVAPLLPFRERRWVPALLMFIDILVVELCLYLGILVRQAASEWFPISLGPSTYIGLTAGVLVLPLAYCLMGLYPGYGISSVERIRRRVTATAIVFSSLLAWDYLVQEGTWSRGVLLGTWLFATVLVPTAVVWLQRVLVRAKLWGMPVVLIGTGETARDLTERLAREPKLGLVPVGFLDDDPRLSGSVIDGIPVLGTLARAKELAETVKIAVLTLPEAGGRRLVELSAKLPFAKVILVPDLVGLQSAWVSTRDLGGILGLEIKKNLLLKHNRVLKRLLDYAVGVPLFIFTLPLMIFLCIAIMAISPGSPFYFQEREGKGGKKLRVLKLRSMYPDAEARLADHLRQNPAAQREWSQYFKLRKDPRVLPFLGRFLRRSSLDEVPQLWNILRGDMSFVGPRPFPDYHLEAFEESFRDSRRSVIPGLTGLWQVDARSEGDLAVQETLDTYYIRNWSLWLDIYILFKTVEVVLVGKGAR